MTDARSRTATGWHEAVDHTADVGLRAGAPDLPAVLIEAARALAELAADVDPRAPTREEPVRVRAADPVGLAYAWLNELIGLAEVEGAALVEATVTRLEHGADGWTLDARVRLAPFDEDRVRPRVGVKAATYHRLRVEETAEGWELDAYLDV